MSVNKPRFYREATNGYIMCNFSYCGMLLRFSTGHTIQDEKDWDKKKQRATSKRGSRMHVYMNEELDKIYITVQEIYREFQCQKLPADFKKELGYRLGWETRPEPKKAPGLIEFLELEYMPERFKAVAPNTFKSYPLLLKHLLGFMESRQVKLNYEDVTRRFAADFLSYLHEPGREFADGYTQKLFKMLKEVLREAQERGYHNNTEYQSKKFTIKAEQAFSIALSFDELERLANVDLSDQPEGLNIARDLFLIGAFTGLRFSDFSRLDAHHVVKVNDNFQLEVPTQKTGERVNIPLFSIAHDLLQKYSFKVPRITNQNFNENIKRVVELAGILDTVGYTFSKGGRRVEVTQQKFELVTSHTARRSFATNYYALGIPAAQLMKITGHRTERQFQTYIRMDSVQNAEIIREKYEKLIVKS